MTIQEALKSGQRFKRPMHEFSAYANGDADIFMSLTREDILADDWIVVPEKRAEICANDIRTVWHRIYREPRRVKSFMEELIKELGLE
jgi:hypothetical protein